jgi:CheY-like chemotaxis protein
MIGAIHYDGGPVPTGVAFVLDMTERKKALEAIENANRAKSRFLAMMSHEIRTPLGVIAGFADLALDPQQSASDRHNALNRIKKNSELLTELVNDILDLSKIEAGKLDYEMKEVETGKFIKDLTESMQIKARAKSIQLEISSEGEIPQYIQTDPLRLRQILYNVIGNAIKFTDIGKVSLSIRSHETEDPNKLKISFLVSDTGIGISEDQRSRLFQPFSQADSTTTRKYGGTGLGLVLSQRLAKALGGDLSLVNSIPGKGSTFEVSLETIKIDAKKIAPLKKKELHTDQECFDGAKVLVIEDSLDIQVLVTEYLKHLNADIDLADNGRIGIEKALKNDYDILLMDISMPELDGFQATMLLRQKGYKKPIVAMSAHAMNEEKELAIKVGFNDYITKPMSKTDLIAKLSSYLNDNKSKENYKKSEKKLHLTSNFDMGHY